MSGTNEAVEQKNKGIRMPYTRQLAILIILSKGKEQGYTLQSMFKSLSRASKAQLEAAAWAAAADEMLPLEFSVALSNTGFFSPDIILILDVFEADIGLQPALEYLKVVCPRTDRCQYIHD